MNWHAKQQQSGPFRKDKCKKTTHLIEEKNDVVLRVVDAKSDASDAIVALLIHFIATATYPFQSFAVCT